MKTFHHLTLATICCFGLLLSACPQSTGPQISDPPRPPDLAELRIPSDSLLANPIVPVAFKGEVFRHDFDLIETAEPLAFDISPYSDTWELHADGVLELRRENSGSLPGKLPRAGVFNMPINVISASDTIRQLVYLSVMGSEQSTSTIKDELHYQLSLPNEYRAQAHVGYSEHLLKSRDLLVFNSLLLRARTRTGDTLRTRFSEPLDLELRYGHMDRFARISLRQLKLLFAPAEDPLAFVVLDAAHDTIQKTFTAQVHELGLFAIGIPNWSASQPEWYKSDQRPEYGSLHQDSTFVLLVQDSIRRVWFFGDEQQQGIPGADSTRSWALQLLDSAASLWESDLGAAPDFEPVVTHLTLDSRLGGASPNSIRLPIFDLVGPDDTRLLASVYQQGLRIRARQSYPLGLEESLYRNSAARSLERIISHLGSKHFPDLVLSSDSLIASLASNGLLDSWASVHQPMGMLLMRRDLAASAPTLPHIQSRYRLEDTVKTVSGGLRIHGNRFQETDTLSFQANWASSVSGSIALPMDSMQLQPGTGVWMTIESPANSALPALRLTWDRSPLDELGLEHYWVRFPGEAVGANLVVLTGEAPPLTPGATLYLVLFATRESSSLSLDEPLILKASL